MATNMVHATYQEIIDMGTVAGKTTVLGLHTPVGKGPMHMLDGFFRQYRKWKYNGIKQIVCVPAAQLPADPLGVSMEAGQILDPRDLLNPILFHGCHGTSLGEALNQIFKTSGFDDQSASLDSVEGAGELLDKYYQALSDPSWKKFGIQSGFRLKHLYPLVHKAAFVSPVLPHYGSYDEGEGEIETQPNYGIGEIDSSGSILGTRVELNSGVNANNHLISNGVARLGWMPTYTFKTTNAGDRVIDTAYPVRTVLERLLMGVILFPPCYNVEQYFRISIVHSFSFKDFTTSLKGGQEAAVGETYSKWYENVQTAKGVPLAETEEQCSVLTDGNATLITSGVF